MSEFRLLIKAYKEVTKSSYGYSSSYDETVHVTEAEIFEAISKFLQVKGFTTEQVAVYLDNQAQDATEPKNGSTQL